jgi:cytochrome c5
MKKLNVVFAGAGVMFMGAVWLQAAARSAERPQVTVPVQTAQVPPAAQAVGAPPVDRALLDKYCVSCHNDGLHVASLSLDRLDVNHVDAHAEIWERVLRKLRSGVMPPPGRPRPDAVTSEVFRTSLEAALDSAAAANPNPGKATVSTSALDRTAFGGRRG